MFWREHSISRSFVDVFFIFANRMHTDMLFYSLHMPKKSQHKSFELVCVTLFLFLGFSFGSFPRSVATYTWQIVILMYCLINRSCIASTHQDGCFLFDVSPSPLCVNRKWNNIYNTLDGSKESITEDNNFIVTWTIKQRHYLIRWMNTSRTESNTEREMYQSPENQTKPNQIWIERTEVNEKNKN